MPDNIQPAGYILPGNVPGVAPQLHNCKHGHEVIGGSRWGETQCPEGYTKNSYNNWCRCQDGMNGTNGTKPAPKKFTLADLKGIQGLAVAGFVFLLIMGAITED